MKRATEKWTELSTINEIIAFVQANPEYKPFLDKPIIIHTCEEYRARQDDWQYEPLIRFSVDHDMLVIETK